MLPRPLLKAIRADSPVVLLVDEVDKSDPEFEAFLLEILSDFQISIPEIGTRKAAHIPFVILTSNNYRDMSDALKRRCLHLYIDYPDKDLETRIVRLKIPNIQQKLCEQMVESIQTIRTMDLKKKPAISETLDWANALMALQVEDLSRDVILNTLNVIVKHRSDADTIKENLSRVSRKAS
jgi:MoxR-like ATPase